MTIELQNSLADLEKSLERINNWSDLMQENQKAATDAIHAVTELVDDTKSKLSQVFQALSLFLHQVEENYNSISEALNQMVNGLEKHITALQVILQGLKQMDLHGKLEQLNNSILSIGIVIQQNQSDIQIIKSAIEGLLPKIQQEFTEFKGNLLSTEKKLESFIIQGFGSLHDKIRTESSEVINNLGKLYKEEQEKAFQETAAIRNEIQRSEKNIIISSGELLAHETRKTKEMLNEKEKAILEGVQQMLDAYNRRILFLIIILALGILGVVMSSTVM